MSYEMLLVIIGLFSCVTGWIALRVANRTLHRAIKVADDALAELREHDDPRSKCEGCGERMEDGEYLCDSEGVTWHRDGKRCDALRRLKLLRVL